MSLAYSVPADTPHTIMSTLLQGNGGAQQHHPRPTATGQPSLTSLTHLPMSTHQLTSSHLPSYSLLTSTRVYPPTSSSSSHGSAVSSALSSPAISATSSPYLSPSLTSNPSTGAPPSPAINMASAHSAVNLEGMLMIGSRIQVRSAEHIHPKLHAFANSHAEIVQLPAHPNTWYGVRLRDGKQVKLRKSAFDVISIYPPGSSVTSSPSLHPQSAAAFASSFQAQTASQPTQLYSPFQFTAFQPQSQPLPMHQYNFQQQSQPQQQLRSSPPSASSSLAVPAKLVYSSPSPSPSPAPVAHSSPNVPAMAGLTVSTPLLKPLRAQPTTSLSPAPAAKNDPSATPSDPMASEEEYEELELPSSATPAAPLSSVGPSPSGSDEDDAALGDSHTMSDGGDATRTASASPRVRHSSRKPVPRALTLTRDDDDDEEDDEEDAEEDAEEEDEEEEEEEEESTTTSKKGASSKRTKAPASGSKSASAPGKSARQRRGRGRALLGLNVVITNGRYKGETGLVIRGANGYYSVKFHRAISELRAHENTAMKRSSELAPITPNGKRLSLPIPPAQRKLMKAQALQAASMGITLTTSVDAISASNSPRIRGASAPGSGSSTAGGEKRKAGVSFSSTAPRDARRRVVRRKDARGGHGGASDESGSSSATDEEQYDDERSPYSSDEDAPHLTHGHSRSHSTSSSRSSSPSRASDADSLSDTSRSPTHTELLTPHSYPASPAYLALTPLVQPASASVPASPAHLPSIALPPASMGASGGMIGKSVIIRSQSPRQKQAACILLALSNEGLVSSPGADEIPIGASSHDQLQYTLTHVQPKHQQETRPEQWIHGAGHIHARRPHDATWQFAH